MIVTAARETFGELGYGGATMRAVAARAGVDPALLYHYFGSKQQLFVATMELPSRWQTVLPALASAPREEIGERLVRLMLGYWEDPQSRPLFEGILRSAATDPTAGAMVRRLLAEGPFQALAKVIGAPDGELRAMLIASHVVGVALLRYILCMEPIASLPTEVLVKTVGATVQHYLTGNIIEA